MIPASAFRLFSILLIWLAAIPAEVRSQVVINEIMPANGDATWDFATQNQPSWIELHNTGKNWVDLSGFFLSDDPGSPQKWRFPDGISIPPSGHIIVWCDNRDAEMYTGFGLSADGEQILFSGPSGLVLDRLTYPSQHLNVSYGRISDGAAEWSFFPASTPGKSNKGPYSRQVAPSPQFSLPAGRVTSGESLTLSVQDPDAVIRYTVDGSEPDELSAPYRDPITINRTITVKARAFGKGLIPGMTVTRSYLLLDRALTLPVVSISTKPSYLWDDFTGIYVEGSNGIAGNCAEKRNWNQDWERHAVMEYFNEEGKREEVQDVDIRVGGACSRNFPQKALVVKARSKYGSDRLSLDVFPNRTTGQVGGFVLRNAGNDFNTGMLRDAFSQALVAGQMDVDFLDYRPAAVYLNGEYWGIMDIREKADSDYFRDNVGLEPEAMDLLEVVGYLNVVNGSAEAWNDYLSGLEGMDRSSSAAFDYIDAHIDVEEYISYVVTEIYLGNTDWPGNNVRMWRPRAPGGKFRWVLWDLDFAFDLFNGFSPATHPTLHFATDGQNQGWPNPAFSTLHLRMLLDNPTFRNRFAARFLTAMEATFHPARINRLLDQFADRISLEVYYHKARWGGLHSDWQNEIQRMKRFASERYAFMKDYAPRFFGFSASSSLNVSTAAPSQGIFHIDGVRVEAEEYSGTVVAGLPVRLTAMPLPGYRFSRWEVTAGAADTVQLLNAESTWRYLDSGQDPGVGWASPDFADASWSEGRGEFGYGDGDEQTVLSFGGDPGAKHITSWFRTSFTLEDTASVKRLAARLKYDDGVVVYLNGIEVYRANLPAGQISAGTLALSAADESMVHAVDLPRQWLTVGSNVLAVEIHQVSPTSSDIGFRFDMKMCLAGEIDRFEEYAPNFELNSTSDAAVVLHFEPDNRSFSGLVINEIAADNLSSAAIREDWLELYNAGDDVLDLDGLLVSDDWSDPFRFVLHPHADQRFLSPRGYLLLKADGRNMAGPLHLPFRLSAEGEYLGIYSASENTVTPIDEIAYDPLSPGASWSCIPDGIKPMVQTSLTTPGGANAFAVGLGDRPGYPAVYPNPFIDRIRFDEPAEQVELFTSTGTRVPLSMDGDRSVSVPELPAGIYVLRFLSGRKSHAVRLVRQ